MSLQEQAEKPTIKIKQAKSLNEISKDYRKEDCLMEPLLRRQGISVLAGGSDTGKSLFMLQLCLAIWSKNEFLGFELHPKYRSFIYLASEDDADEMMFRVSRQSNKMPLPQNKFEDQVFLFDGDDLILTLDQALQKQPADLVVLDTYMDIMSLNTRGQGTNSGDETRRFLSKIKALVELHKTHVCFVHHTRKGTDKAVPHKDALIGSQSLEGKVRLVLHLRREEELSYMSILKGNYLPNEMKSISHVLKFDKESFTYENTGLTVPIDFNAPDEESVSLGKEEMRKRAFDLLSQGKEYKEVSTALMIPLKTLYKWFPKKGNEVVNNSHSPESVGKPENVENEKGGQADG